MIIVLFDGNCRICTTSILKYKQLLPGLLEIKNLHQVNTTTYALTLEELQRSLHVIYQQHTYEGLAALQVI